MAKAGFILHGARGKVGNVVAQKGRNGNTTLREHVVPKNPKTNKQTAQRIILATVAQAAKFMEPIIDHSFQGVAIGAVSKEHFRKLNMKKLRALASLDFMENPTGVNSHAFTTTKSLQALIPNAYTIASGNLSSLKLNLELKDRTGLIGEAKDFIVKFPTQFSVPILHFTDGGIPSVRLGDLMKGLFGITTPGEQITFVAIQKAGEGYQYTWQGDPTLPGAMIAYTSMKAVRLFINPTLDFNEEYEIYDTEGHPLSNINEVITDNIVRAFALSTRSDQNLLNYLSTYLENVVGCTVDATASKLDIALDNSDEFNFTEYNEDADGLGYVYALGIIRSRLMDDGTWQYNNCDMTLNRPSINEQYNFGLYWNAAIQAWFESNEVASDELYLRGGTDSDVIGEDFT